MSLRPKCRKLRNNERMCGVFVAIGVRSKRKDGYTEMKTRYCSSSRWLSIAASVAAVFGIALLGGGTTLEKPADVNGNTPPQRPPNTLVGPRSPGPPCPA